MLDRIALLRELVSTAGVSGCEERTAKLISRLAQPYSDEVKIDTMGNVICHKSGSGKSILFSTHIDVVGVIVSGYDIKGNVYVNFSGSVNTAGIWNRAIRFEHGTMGILRPNRVDFHKKTAESISGDDVYIETGAETYEQAGDLLALGEGGVWVSEIHRCGDNIIGAYLDGMAGVVILLEMMERIHDCQNDLWFIFSTCGEIRSNGVGIAAYNIPCNYVIAVGASNATDAPSGDNEYIRKALGKGPCLMLRENRHVADRCLQRMLVELAEKNSIPYQFDITCLDTDAGEFADVRGDIRMMSVCLPYRYVHSPDEIVNENDMNLTQDLLRIFAQSEL